MTRICRYFFLIDTLILQRLSSDFGPEFQNINNIYPGDSVYCNNYSPHAKWHLEGAPGLQDLIYLSNDVYVTLTDALSRSSNN